MNNIILKICDHAASKMNHLPNRTNHSFLLFLTLFIFDMILPHMNTALKAQDQKTLSSIKFIGNDSIPDTELGRQLILKENGALRKILFWKEPHLFNENILQQDIEKLNTFYQTEGFVNIQITPQIKPDKDKVRLEYEINEGPATLVSSISYQVSSPDSSIAARAHELLSKIEPKLKLKKNKTFPG